EGLAFVIVDDRNLLQSAQQLLRGRDMIGEAFVTPRQRGIARKHLAALPAPWSVPAAERRISVLAQSRRERSLVARIGAQAGNRRPTTMFKRPRQRIMLRPRRRQARARGRETAFRYIAFLCRRRATPFGFDATRFSGGQRLGCRCSLCFRFLAGAPLLAAVTQGLQLLGELEPLRFDSGELGIGGFQRSLGDATLGPHR